MALYEMVLIARNDVSAAQVEALVDELGEQLGQADGKIVKREFWGLRTLAYKIKKNRRGHYVLLGLDAPFAALAEAERRLRLNEDVLRFLTLKVEAIDEAPSVMMQRKGEERGTDRSARGPRPGGRFESGRSPAPRHSAPAASESVTEGE